MHSTLQYVLTVEPTNDPEDSMEMTFSRLEQAVFASERLFGENDYKVITPVPSPDGELTITCVYDSVDELMVDLLRSGIKKFDFIMVHLRSSEEDVLDSVDYNDLIEWISDGLELFDSCESHYDIATNETTFDLISHGQVVFRIQAHKEA